MMFLRLPRRFPGQPGRYLSMCERGCVLNSNVGFQATRTWERPELLWCCVHGTRTCAGDNTRPPCPQTSVGTGNTVHKATGTSRQVSVHLAKLRRQQPEPKRTGRRKGLSRRHHLTGGLGLQVRKGANCNSISALDGSSDRHGGIFKGGMNFPKQNLEHLSR